MKKPLRIAVTAGAIVLAMALAILGWAAYSAYRDLEGT